MRVVQVFVTMLAVLTVAKALAQTPPNSRKNKTSPAQWGVVGLDGATVYQTPDFDGKALIRLEPGFKAIISQKALPGREGVGLFYRIKFGANRFGFVADTEVIPQFKVESSGSEANRKNPVFDQVESLRERAVTGLAPISETRYFGFGVSHLSYQDQIQGQRRASALTVFGIRWTGPDLLFDGPPLDLNLAYADSATSGSMLLLDVLFRVAFFERRPIAMEGGLGLVFNHSSLRFQDALSDQHQTKSRFGAVADIGIAARQAKIIARLSAKYYYTGNAYPAVLFSLQHQY